MPEMGIEFCLKLLVAVSCFFGISEAYPYFRSPWSWTNTPLGTFSQPRRVYIQDTEPTMDNPADFGHGLSNPPPIPPGVDPNTIPYSQWSVMTGNSADPYAYQNMAHQYGLAPMTGIMVNNRQIGQGGFARGFFPVPVNQVGQRWA